MTDKNYQDFIKSIGFEPGKQNINIHVSLANKKLKVNPDFVQDVLQKFAHYFYEIKKVFSKKYGEELMNQKHFSFLIIISDNVKKTKEDNCVGVEVFESMQFLGHLHIDGWEID